METLPLETLMIILDYLPLKELLAVMPRVCKEFSILCYTDEDLVDRQLAERYEAPMTLSVLKSQIKIVAVYRHVCFLHTTKFTRPDHLETDLKFFIEYNNLDFCCRIYRLVINEILPVVPCNVRHRIETFWNITEQLLLPEIIKRMRWELWDRVVGNLSLPPFKQLDKCMPKDLSREQQAMITKSFTRWMRQRRYGPQDTLTKPPWIKTDRGMFRPQ